MSFNYQDLCGGESENLLAQTGSNSSTLTHHASEFTKKLTKHLRWQI
jgi:hypothetical protein